MSSVSFESGLPAEPMIPVAEPTTSWLMLRLLTVVTAIAMLISGVMGVVAACLIGGILLLPIGGLALAELFILPIAILGFPLGALLGGVLAVKRLLIPRGMRHPWILLIVGTLGVIAGQVYLNQFENFTGGPGPAATALYFGLTALMIPMIFLIADLVVNLAPGKYSGLLALRVAVVCAMMILAVQVARPTITRALYTIAPTPTPEPSRISLVEAFMSQHKFTPYGPRSVSPYTIQRTSMFGDTIAISARPVNHTVDGANDITIYENALGTNQTLQQFCTAAAVKRDKSYSCFSAGTVSGVPVYKIADNTSSDFDNLWIISAYVAAKGATVLQLSSSGYDNHSPKDNALTQQFVGVVNTFEPVSAETLANQLDR